MTFSLSAISFVKTFLVFYFTVLGSEGGGLFAGRDTNQLFNYPRYLKILIV